MSSQVYKKNPTSVLDYTINWSEWLDGNDYITSSSWTGNSINITLNNDSFTTTTTTVWVSGGVTGEVYILENIITTALGRTEKQYLIIECEGVTTIKYLIPLVRLRLGDSDYNSYRYTDEWLTTALIAAIQMSGKWLNYKYLLDNDNNIYRNPNAKFIFPEPPTIELQDEYIITLMAAILVIEGSLENSAWDIASWRDNEIYFSNLEQARTRNQQLSRLWDELLNTLKPPAKRLSKAIKGSLPGYKGNPYEQ